MGTNLKNLLEESKKMISSKISVYETLQNVKFSTKTKKKKRRLKRRSITKMKLLKRRLKEYTRKLNNVSQQNVAKLQEATAKLNNFFKKKTLTN